MKQTAILGAGVMGETLLSGLVRAGRRVDDLLVGEKRPDRARELEERYGVRGRLQRRGGPQGRHRRRRRQAAGHGGPARRDRPSCGRAAGRLAGRRHHHRLHRVAGARGRRRRPGHAQHARPRRRGDGRDLARLPLRRRSTSPRPRRCCASIGKVLRIPERQMDAVTAISGSGPAYIFFVVESMIEAGVHLACRAAPPPSSSSRPLVGSATMLRETGTHPDVCASRSPRPAARPRPRCASSRSTRCAPRSSPPWRPRETDRAISPRVRAGSARTRTRRPCIRHHRGWAQRSTDADGATLSSGHLAPIRRTRRRRTRVPSWPRQGGAVGDAPTYGYRGEPGRRRSPLLRTGSTTRPQSSPARSRPVARRPALGPDHGVPRVPPARVERPATRGPRAVAEGRACSGAWCCSTPRSPRRVRVRGSRTSRVSDGGPSSRPGRTDARRGWRPRKIAKARTLHKESAPSDDADRPGSPDLAGCPALPDAPASPDSAMLAGVMGPAPMTATTCPRRSGPVRTGPPTAAGGTSVEGGRPWAGRPPLGRRSAVVVDGLRRWPRRDPDAASRAADDPPTTPGGRRHRRRAGPDARDYFRTTMVGDTMVVRTRDRRRAARRMAGRRRRRPRAATLVPAAPVSRPGPWTSASSVGAPSPRPRTSGARRRTTGSSGIPSRRSRPTPVPTVTTRRGPPPETDEDGTPWSTPTTGRRPGPTTRLAGSPTAGCMDRDRGNGLPLEHGPASDGRARPR